MDYVGIALFILLLLGESVADQQQWRFQSKKYELKGKGAKLTGFFFVWNYFLLFSFIFFHFLSFSFIFLHFFLHFLAFHIISFPFHSPPSLTTPLPNPKTTQKKGDYAKGFLTSGLFRYSRHPNFFCEISIWWAVYLSSVAASGLSSSPLPPLFPPSLTPFLFSPSLLGAWLNWSVLGAFLLFLLFQGSTQFTEEITSRKYPEYRRYQRTTSRLIPMFPGRG